MAARTTPALTGVTRSGDERMARAVVACDTWTMLYSFHGHESDLDLKDVIAFEPDLTAQLAKQLREPNVEDAVAVALDFYGAAYVREQAAHLEVVGRKWAELAPLAQTPNDKERVKAIPERLCFRLDQVWREGRAAVYLVLRSVAMRHGCAIEDAPLFVDMDSVASLMELIVDGLRAGFAASVDASVVVALLERAVKPRADGSRELDWATEAGR